MITQAEAQAEAAAWGCTATVSHQTYPGFNAYYSPYQHRIVLLGFDTAPLSWQRFVLAHEVGHCLQAQADEFSTLAARGPHEVEWDADSFAIRAVYDRWGMDGADLNAQIWADLYREYNFDGVETGPHGTSVDRQTRGELNRRVYHAQGA